MLERTLWVSALSALPSNELIEITSKLSEGWTLRPKSVPQAGLGMLQIKDSAFHQAFYLGEFPLASAWLEVTTLDGRRAEGAAQVMDDCIEIAEALALCDAILSAQLPGWEKVSMMIEKGLTLRNTINKERKMMLARTRVDFSLLDDTGNGEGLNNVES
ncbi:MAG: phosphonate C-P lyase system protein PhnG [Gammaproteobacteria bacterium]|nr:phosphonate C-P lyase system protein PhnG [Gammaproteobacteria bacterium]MCW8988509.1 phosphonate C-P lyase system protein PhnG [Gammaproteobacteria bacterium]